MEDAHRHYLDFLIRDFHNAKTEEAKSSAASNLATAYRNIAVRTANRAEREMLLNCAQNWSMKIIRNRIPASPNSEFNHLIKSMRHTPTMRYSDLGGVETIQRRLQKITVKSELDNMPDDKPNILLYGPPGTGKTSLVMSLAGEMQKPLYAASIGKTLSRWFGESPKIINSLYDEARRESERAFIFLDDCEVLSGNRDDDSNNSATKAVVSTFLDEMDGEVAKSSPNQPITICCCNNPHQLDKAFTSRMTTQIYIRLPNPESVISIIQVLAHGYQIDKEVNLQTIANTATRKLYGGRELKRLVSSAVERMIDELNPDFDKEWLKLNKEERRKFRLKLRPLNQNDFEAAFGEIRSAITERDLRKYEEWESQQKQKGD